MHLRCPFRGQNISLFTLFLVVFLLEHEPIITLATKNLSAVFGWFLCLVGVLLILTPLTASPLISNALWNYAGRFYLIRLGSAETVLDQFTKLFYAVMKSGNHLKVIWYWTQAMWDLANVMGVKVIFIYQGMKDVVTKTNPFPEL